MSTRNYSLVLSLLIFGCGYAANDVRRCPVTGAKMIDAVCRLRPGYFSVKTAKYIISIDLPNDRIATAFEHDPYAWKPELKVFMLGCDNGMICVCAQEHDKPVKTRKLKFKALSSPITDMSCHVNGKLWFISTKDNIFAISRSTTTPLHEGGKFTFKKVV
jgi:hypothetical protein